ncbi:type II secretion system F family protein [Poriferisphaera sp. WC338]|uniref:type II secretion system F family protein n=1 Tax=Poriferisphaera sp. WC338 TaxID=3425129 RepID=UPI003D8157F2
MKLTYHAFDASGAAVRDSIEAINEMEATDRLRSKGLFVTEIRAQDDVQTQAENNKPKWRMPSLNGGTKRLKHLTMFTRQLYVLISSGTPMIETLSALERQAKDPTWQAVVSDLRERIEQGDSLSDAMDHHPRYFDQIYRSLIRAGEAGGKFSPILDRLSTLVRKQLQTRTTIMGAMMYPALLLAVSGAVLTLMLVFVLPRFASLFETLKMPLPPSTKFMMFISMCLQSYWWAILIGAIAVTFGLFYWIRTPQGRSAFDLFLIRVPMFGVMTRSFVVARIIRLIGVLTDSYVPLLDVLELTSKTAGNVHYQKLIDDAMKSVENGDPMSQAFSDPKMVDPSVYEAIKSGESAGRLSDMLLNMADFVDEENETVLKSLTSLLEPVILIVLGVLVGAIALSMFLPLFDLTAMTGGS